MTVLTTRVDTTTMSTVQSARQQWHFLRSTSCQDYLMKNRNFCQQLKRSCMSYMKSGDNGVLSVTVLSLSKSSPAFYAK